MDGTSLKNAITMKDFFKKLPISWKRKPILIETDRGNISQNFLINNIVKHYSRNTYLGALLAEHFNRTSRDLLKRPVFEKGESNWVDIIPTITKQYDNRVHSSTKQTPIQASLKKNGG